MSEETRGGVFIHANRMYGRPAEAEDYTCTVGGLRKWLESFDEDAKVFVVNDGEVYGHIDCYDDVYFAEYDDYEVYPVE